MKLLILHYFFISQMHFDLQVNIINKRRTKH